MTISVIEPIAPAIERTKLVLFQPFDLAKWFKLGFCAFLAMLGEGGSPNFSGNSGGGGGGEPDLEPVWSWIQENLAIIVTIAVAVLVAGCLFGLLVTWLSSRGKFMFIDGVVQNRGAVVAPWSEYRQQGNSLFWFRVVFGVCSFLVFLLLVGGCALIALPSIQAEEFGPSAAAALAIGIPLFILLAIVVGLVGFCLAQFVTPIMYLRRCGVMAAWSSFRYEILTGHVGALILYLLFQIVIGIAVGVVALAATCLTCCLTIVPYLGTVILLPLFVFTQSYSLYYLQQFGDEWIFFRDQPPPKPPPIAGGPSEFESAPKNPFGDAPLT